MSLGPMLSEGRVGCPSVIKALPSSGFGAFHRDVLDKLEQTVKSLARDRHLIEYAGIQLVLQARRFVTESIFPSAVGHPALGGTQAVRQQDGESAIKTAGKGMISRERSEEHTSE